MSDQVDEVKSKTDIVSLIGEYVTLKKAGRNFKGLCPFHAEKTPSFMVSPELQIFKCFGCSESGDAISFLQKYEGMEFLEALQSLAERAGVKLRQYERTEISEREKIFEINKFATRFYHYVLLNHDAGRKALAYLTQKRGLKIDTIEKFELGYSPFATGALAGALVGKKNLKDSDLERAGLVYFRGGTGTSVVDRFAGRVIFPLFDHRGNVVGFAGRLLPDDKRTEVGKYINSPETPAYSKSKVLYGLNFVKQDIKREGCAIIVEGELDMIASWQAGVKNVVAIKGSALTEDQVRLLARFTQEVILALDTDFAGDAAARRGIAVAQAQGLTVRVAVLKGYKDPDEMARANPGAYKDALKGAVGVWDFIIDSVSAKYAINTGEGKGKVSRELVPVLRAIEDKIVQAHYIEKVAVKLAVPREAVMEEVAAQKSPVADAPVPPESGESEKTRRERVEESFLALAFQTDPKILLEKDVLPLFTQPLSVKILTAYRKWHEAHPKAEFDPAAFSKQLPAELVEGFAAVLMADAQIIDPEKAKRELLVLTQELSALLIRERLARVRQELAKAEAEGNGALSLKLQKEFAGFSKKLSELEETRLSGIIG